MNYREVRNYYCSRGVLTQCGSAVTELKNQSCSGPPTRSPHPSIEGIQEKNDQRKTENHTFTLDWLCFPLVAPGFHVANTW